ncbi:hypothetical protein ATE71_07605 [Sphingopyxis sp. H115]|nr:hypothetical protein ATE71_07605 [Sphingopyxis sp. H115]
MAGRRDRTFLLGDMADNFVEWFILGQFIGEHDSQSARNTWILAVSANAETEWLQETAAC